MVRLVSFETQIINTRLEIVVYLVLSPRFCLYEQYDEVDGHFVKPSYKITVSLII